MKRIKYILFSIALVFISATNIYALGSASVTVSGPSSVSLNSNITLNIVVSNIKGGVGVAGINGTIIYDPTYLEYVSSNQGSGVPFQLTENSPIAGKFKISGTSSTSFRNDTVIYTYVFKAKNAGTTKLRLTDFDLSADDDDANLFDPLTVSDKEIIITDGNQSQGGGTTDESNENTLTSLSVDNYPLTPAYSKTETTYQITVPTDAKTIKINARINDAGATISGTGSVDIEGKNKVEVKVKAENGDIKVYTININRKDDVVPVDTTPTETKSNDATLKKLDPSGYTMSPTFKKNVTSYTIKVGEKVDSLDITALPTSDKAKVEITGNKNWKDGANEVKITVTAEDGTKKIYILNVMKNVKGTTTSTPKSSNTYLKELTINDGELTPAFNKKIDTYNITVPNTVDKLDIKAISEDNNAKVEISGNKNLEVGINLVTITVTAEDGTKRVYTLNVTKSSEKSDTDLTTLTVSGGELSPKFDPNVTKYKMSVSNKTDKVKVTAIPKADDSTVTVEGNEDLVEGINTIIVKVKDKNGFVKYYEIEVDKKAKSKFLGLDFDTWLKIGLGILGLLLLGFFLFLIFRKKKKENVDITQAIPKFEFKPEFNFNSKNGTDDDIVEAGATLNQISGNVSKPKELETKEDIAKVVDAEYKEIPYDPYDEIVTKDELYDAILEAKETKDTTMLKMLLDQEKLNREKEKIRKEHSDNE